MSDKNLNKNAFFENFLSSNDENKVDGMQIQKMSKSTITNLLQNPNTSDLKPILINIIERIENLEKKQNKYIDYIAVKSVTEISSNVLHILDKENIKYKMCNDSNVMQNYLRLFSFYVLFKFYHINREKSLLTDFPHILLK